MSDGDSGNSGDSGDSGDYNDASAGHSRGSGSPSWDVLCRAMRWETLALLVFLVVLAALAS
ncbi:hypothetical protein [Streptomyces lydicus]|uniref:hypothetical protein n=1 Tax=Streptomyces lydicus TaxID=47763 RepID=UPI000527F319|nr:hypothetical protein [Streptomyces lydicus]MDC7335509.1 hypothetical protein [Streptomyces lydicus]UEG95279.1 hypothetical protein LJ741_34835 [Streptomyces lydicus]